MRNLGQFVRAIVSHGIAAVTGVTISFIGFMWQIAAWIWPEASFPAFRPWVLWVPGSGLMFLSAFWAWRDEHDRAERFERTAKKLRDDLPRPLVTATYSAPRDFRSTSHVAVVQDEFAFENLADVVALNVLAEIADLPDSLEAQMIWDVSVSASSVLPILRKGQPVTMTPWVVRHHNSRENGFESSGYAKIDGPLSAELQKASRTSPYPKSWMLRITYKDDRNRTLQTTCEIQVDSDLGGIITTAKEIGRVTEDPATP